MNRDRARDFLRSLSQMERDLPCSPSLLQKISTAVSQQSPSSLEEISQLIRQDQALAARLLALSNSSYYSLKVPVSSVARAVSVLGLQEIRNLLHIIILRHFAARLAPGLLDLDEYLKHNFRVGMYLRYLSHKTSVGEPEELFTAGLLHDIGKLLTALHRPGDWQQICSLHAQSWSFARTELRYWGIDHGMVGARILRTWHLPQGLTDPIQKHHTFDAVTEENAQTALLCLADLLEHMSRKPEPHVSVRMQPILSFFGLTQDAIMEELLDRFPPTMDTLNLFCP